MSLATVEGKAERPTADRLNLYLSAELRARLKRAAAIRGTSESATAVKFLERSVEWFESLSREDREAV